MGEGDDGEAAEEEEEEEELLGATELNWRGGREGGREDRPMDAEDGSMQSACNRVDQD